MNVLLFLLALLAFLGLVFFYSFLLVCFSISFFFQVSGQGACEAGGTDGSGGEKNPSGGGMQVFNFEINVK